MLTLATASRHTTLAIILLAAGITWVIAAMGTATYGDNRGFRFGPLFICSLLIGFPLVLLAITIATPFLDLQMDRRKGS